ncbi:hypothetical protein BDR03DRAFT_1023275 [Suillus americanus]|nr:hypothetical protein BDR03DRAFT_1023275 [Suillus americanus]
MSSTCSLSSRLSPSIGLSPAASDSSFLTVKYNQTFPSQSSLYLADKGDDQRVPPSPGNNEKVLPTPNPAFNHAKRFSYAYPFVFSWYRSCVSSVQHLHQKQEFWKEHYQAGRLGVDAETSIRTTMVDMWAPPLHRSVSSDHIRPNSPAISATYRHGGSPTKPRQRTTSCHALPSSVYSSAIGSPPVPPIPTQYRQLNCAPYATQHQQVNPTRGPFMLPQSSSEESYTTQHEDREENPRESRVIGRILRE